MYDVRCMMYERAVSELDVLSVISYPVSDIPYSFSSAFLNFSAKASANTD